LREHFISPPHFASEVVRWYSIRPQLSKRHINHSTIWELFAQRSGLQVKYTHRSKQTNRSIMKTYAIQTTKANHYVCASSRASAVMKFCGMREQAAIAAGQVLSVKLCK
jgi:ADP-ribosylglycohydrolase